MKMTRQLLGLCLVIGMTISGNSSVFSQGPTVDRAISKSYLLPSPSNTLPVLENEIQALSLGDKVPDIEFSLLNYPNKTAKLSDFSGKLVILDFWATWCTTCIKNFSKMDSLQKKFDNKLQIILVNSKGTGDNLIKIDGFIEKWKSKYKDFQLPTAIMDSVADKYFSHREIPHYVWIGPDGNVIAITSSAQVSSNNITKFFQSGIAPSSKQKDVNPDSNHPFFLNSDVEINDMTQYSFFSKGYKGGIPSGYRLRQTNNEVREIAITNTTIFNMYKRIINFQLSDTKIDSKRVILEVKDSSKLLFNNKSDRDEWSNDNLYSFELIVPVAEKEKLYTYALNELNRYSDYNGRVEKRIVKCLILKTVDNVSEKCSKSIAGKDDGYKTQRQFKNVPIDFLIAWLNSLKSITLPFINETKYTGNIDLSLPEEAKDVSALKAGLKKCGYDLIEENRELEVLIIKDKK